MQDLFTMPNVHVLLQFLQECNFNTNIWRFYSFKCFKHSLSNSILYWFLCPSAEIFWVHRVSTLARAVRKLQIWSFCNNSGRRFMAKMLPIRNKTLKNQSINLISIWLMKKCMFCLLDNWNTPSPQQLAYQRVCIQSICYKLHSFCSCSFLSLRSNLSKMLQYTWMDRLIYHCKTYSYKLYRSLW